MAQTPPSQELASRAVLRTARRVVVKAGTSVLTNENGQVSLTRIGAIVEQISELVKDGVEVIFVSSGATGMGKRVLRKQGRMHLSLNELHSHDEHGNDMDIRVRDSSFKKQSLLSSMSQSSSFANLLDQSYNKTQKQKHYDSACAAAGQFELMNLYSSLFNQCDMTPSQVLLTQGDFQNAERLQNLTYTVDRLLSLGIIPIINENDAVSGNTGYTPADVFSDNDSLAALCARTFNAGLLIMLTDVDGVYDRPPSEEGASLVKFFKEGDGVVIGEKSDQGRGGMGAKISAALGAVEAGSNCTACVVVGGDDLDAIRSIVGRRPKDCPPKGTLFVTPGTRLHELASAEEHAEKVCTRVNI